MFHPSVNDNFIGLKPLIEVFIRIYQQPYKFNYKFSLTNLGPKYISGPYEQKLEPWKEFQVGG